MKGDRDGSAYGGSGFRKPEIRYSPIAKRAACGTLSIGPIPPELQDSEREKTVMEDSERNFILQQGMDEPEPQAAHGRYSALLFQPRIVGLAVLSGIH